MSRPRYQLILQGVLAFISQYSRVEHGKQHGKPVIGRVKIKTNRLKILIIHNG
jgi:hypothetical protein